MKIVVFQVALLGLFFLASPGVAQYAPMNPTGISSYGGQQYWGQQPARAPTDGTQYTNPSYLIPPPTTPMPNANWGTNVSGNSGQVTTTQAASPFLDRYPLIPPNNSDMGLPAQPAYPQMDRNTIQQPKFYSASSTPGIASQPIPRVFSQTAGSTINSQPGLIRVANNYGHPGYGAPNPPVYQQVVSPQDPSSAPSNLPIPANNPGPDNLAPNPGRIERLAPQVQSQAVPQPASQAGPMQPNLDAHHYYHQPMVGGTGYHPWQFGSGLVGNYHAGFGSGCGDACCGQRLRLLSPGCCNRGVWYGSMGGLVFDRNFEDDHVVANPLGLPLINSLVSTQADTGTMGGFEATVGYRFCNGFGIEGVYWGLFSEQGVAAANTGNPQNNWPTADALDYNVSTMDVYLNNSLAFRIRRTNEFHNAELNFFCRKWVGGEECCSPTDDCYGQAALGTGYDCGGVGCGHQGCNSCFSGRRAWGGEGCCRRLCGLCSRPFQFDLIAGFRFFRFDENFFFQTSATGDYSPNINDVNYDIDVENNLVGLQLGGNIEYCLFRRWSLVGGTRFGVYGNSITQRQQIYGLAGYATTNTGVYTGQDYNLRSTETDVAFLGQLNLGLRYAIGCRWSLGFGYRVIAVNGVALAPEQIPYDFSHYQEANAINSNSGLILHGGYLRVEYNF